jgi:hypothetical protein
MTMAYCFLRGGVSLAEVAALPGALPAPTAAMVPAARKPRRLTPFCLSSFTEISIRVMDLPQEFRLASTRSELSQNYGHIRL